MVVEKRVFSLQNFTFEAGVSLPVEIGYETYGSLNVDRSNAILLCHYFSGSSHAAGRYSQQSENDEPGWWDSIIGPGKAFDTNRYFIICSDVLCNVSPYSPYVVTTGPSSINPNTGEKYGTAFPEVTIRDFVRVQYELVQFFGIQALYCVAGPSMGGMQAIQWAVDYPDAMKKVISVISGGRMSAYTGVIPLQIGIDAICLSPEGGLRLAVKMLTLQNRSYNSIAKMWGYPVSAPQANRDWNTQPQSYLQELESMVDSRLAEMDPDHWLYICRANQLFNLASGYGSYDEALSRIKADVLAMPVSSDLMLPPQESKDMIERLIKLGKNAQYHEVESDMGHLAGLLEPEKFAIQIQLFLDS